ncbi:MAG: winged helix-turn-helix transcriptional regulator [Verrucomicrobia bacterium]|nr:winged helix-turn-helix transcriptional regulator [Verrucomicrobiota bacterium]MBI3868893.1 winged helix-turn-helix transcriptional regulator [Verrucomicrobiota bacterium]
MRSLTQAAKAFVDPTRVRVLAALLEGEMCVCELCDALRMTQSTLSTHLAVIRASGLAGSRKEGKWMYYSLLPEAREPIRSLFQFFGHSTLRRHPSLAPDAARLRRRLALRADGACRVGMRTRPSLRPIHAKKNHE